MLCFLESILISARYVFKACFRTSSADTFAMDSVRFFETLHSPTVQPVPVNASCNAAFIVCSSDLNVLNGFPSRLSKSSCAVIFAVPSLLFSISLTTNRSSFVSMYPSTTIADLTFLYGTENVSVLSSSSIEFSIHKSLYFRKPFTGTLFLSNILSMLSSPLFHDYFAISSKVIS